MQHIFITPKRMTIIYFLICTICISCNAANNGKETNSSNSASPGKGNILKMKLAAIPDNAVSKTNAIMFLLPDGWQQSGQISWDFQNTMFPANGEVHISNPDNTSQLHIYKSQYFMRATQTMYSTGFGPGKRYLGCLVVSGMPASTTQAAANVLQELNCLPAETKFTDTKVTAINSTNPADIQAVKNNPQIKFISDNVTSKGSFTKNGATYTILVSSVVNATIGNDYASWSVKPSIFIIKQDAQEKEKTELLHTIFYSFRATPAFTSTCLQVSKKLSDRFYQGIRNAAALSAQISRNNDLMIQGIDKSYAQANKEYSSSSNTDGFDQYIRGTENYTDADGGIYELPGTYNTAWKSANGEVILTNDVSYNPNADKSIGNQNWEALKK